MTRVSDTLRAALTSGLGCDALLGTEDDAGDRWIEGTVNVDVLTERLAAAARVQMAPAKVRRDAWRTDPLREARVKAGRIPRTGIEVAIPVDPDDWMGPRRSVDIAALDRESLAAYLMGDVVAGHPVDVVGRILGHGDALSDVYSA